MTSPTITRAGVAVVAAALALTTAAACGKENGDKSSAPSTPASAPPTTQAANKTPQQILDEAVAALSAAKSMRVEGAMVDNNQEMAVDITTDGTNAQGKLTVPVQGTQMAMEIIKIGDRVYVKSRDIWKKLAPSLAARYGDRWMVSTAQMKQQFADFFTPAGWAKIMKADGTVTREPDSTVEGKPVYTLKDKSNGLLYISSQGTPLPLRLGGGDGKSGGEMNFHYDVPVNVSPPPNPIDPRKGPAGL